MELIRLHRRRQPPVDTKDIPVAVNLQISTTTCARWHPALEGRHFTEQDSKDAPGVVIVDEMLAQRFFPGEEAIGRRLKWVGRIRRIPG